jgi:hypothetical protein
MVRGTPDHCAPRSARRCGQRRDQAGFQVSINGRIWMSNEAEMDNLDLVRWILGIDEDVLGTYGYGGVGDSVLREPEVMAEYLRDETPAR